MNIEEIIQSLIDAKKLTCLVSFNGKSYQVQVNPKEQVVLLLTDCGYDLLHEFEIPFFCLSHEHLIILKQLCIADVELKLANYIK